MAALLVPVLLLAATLQEPPVPPPPAPVIAAQAARVFNLKARNEPVATLFMALAAQAGVKLRLVNYLPQMATVEATGLTLEQGMAALCEASGAACRKLDDGTWVAGSLDDLSVYTAEPDDTKEVDVIHRCENLTADSLATVLAKSFPALRIQAGPSFVTPTVDFSATLNSDSSKAVGITDSIFKTHDVLVGGPAGVVRRALAMALQLDRVRKQVRILARLTEVKGSLDSTLGVRWDAAAATPQPSSGDGANGGSGLRFLSFMRGPMVLNAALKAQEARGNVKALASPNLVMMDGERSFVLIGSRYLFPKQTGTSAGIPVYDTTEVRVGIHLQMAVMIGLNEDIVLTLFPQVSSVTGYTQIGPTSYPIISTREAQTTVRLRSGDTVVVAGLTQNVSSTDGEGIPLLSRIPLLGSLFGTNHKQKLDSELVLMVTPEILPEPGSEGAVTSRAVAAGDVP